MGSRYETGRAPHFVERRERAVELLRKGEDPTAVAERFGVPRSRVGEWARAAGVDISAFSREGNVRQLAKAPLAEGRVWGGFIRDPSRRERRR